jgi:hypothetical protein
MVPCLHQTGVVSRVGIIVAFATLTACGSPITVMPDAAGDPDAAPGAGLKLAYAIEPSVPGPILPGATIDSVSLSVKDLRLTGDAAPGDDRTRAALVAIGWGQELTPSPTIFDKAPPGLYSKIAFKLESDAGNAFRVEGTVLWGDGKSHHYVIEDDNAVAVTVPMDVMLQAGGGASDTLEFHLIDALILTNWTHAKIDEDGNVKLDDGELHDFHDRMSKAFSAASYQAHNAN